MVWQDIAIGIGVVVFVISLIPTLLNKNAKVPLSTSVPTCIVLYTNAFALFTLGLYFSAVMTLVTGTEWLLITILRRV